jgi:hypothetical protein
LASSEWLREGFVANICCRLTSRQVAAIYALRITLYDTNLFVANATPTRKRQRVASSEWRKDRTTGLRDNGPQDYRTTGQRDHGTTDYGTGETVKRRHGETEIYALRFTHHESRITLHEPRLTNYALRFTNYDSR